MPCFAIKMPDSFLHGRVKVATGDITAQKVDAIVNAANSTLLGGGGVDGAIHRNGGPQILAECRNIRRAQYPKGLPPGQAVITTGGNLPARHVIHTVGPIYGYHQGSEATLLADCYRNSLSLAVAHKLQTIAFPAISTGAFGYPAHEAAHIVSETLTAFLAQDDSLQEIRLVFFMPRDVNIFLRHQKFPLNTRRIK
jgi:O-acetyl-ADP-ribose deacetylase (regulator of RNase III)